MLVKICGLRRLEDIEYANILKPDYIGFIFALNKTTLPIFCAKLYQYIHEETICQLSVSIIM